MGTSATTRSERLTSDALIRDPVGNYPTATVACLDPTRGELPRRQLDEAVTRAYLERLCAAGAQSLLIASSSGQGHLRTPDELERWFGCAAGADIGNAMLIALLRPEDGERVNARLLDRVAELGYPVVFLRPGTDLPPDADDAGIAASLAPLVEGAAERGLAVGLYSISDVSGVALTPNAVAHSVSGTGGDHIVAVKVTEADYEASTAAFLADQRLRHLKIVQGWDPHLARALRDGPSYDRDGRQRTGITSGVMAFAIHQYQHILRAAGAAQWEEVDQARRAVDQLFAAMQDDAGHFADLQRAKYVMGLGHPILGTVSDAQAGRILEALEHVERAEDRQRLAASLDLMGAGPFHERLRAVAGQ